MLSLRRIQFGDWLVFLLLLRSFDHRKVGFGNAGMVFENTFVDAAQMADVEVAIGDFLASLSASLRAGACAAEQVDGAREVIVADPEQLQELVLFGVEEAAVVSRDWQRLLLAAFVHLMEEFAQSLPKRGLALGKEVLRQVGIVEPADDLIAYGFEAIGFAVKLG